MGDDAGQFRAAVAPGRSPAAIDELNAGLPALAAADGFGFLSSTRVGSRTALRLCTINPRTTCDDVERTLEVVASPAAPPTALP